MATLLVTPNLISAFYLPGVAPTSYPLGSRVPLNVNHLTPGSSPDDESLRSIVSLDYYHPAFHFCQPENGPRYISESLGSILFGDRISTSPFELHMGTEEPCKALCKDKFDTTSASFVNVWIWQNYNLNFLIDGLPAGQLNYDNATDSKFYSSGFALGSVNGEEVILHNHYTMVIDYHEVKTPGRETTQYRVVGVEVVPSSRGNSKILTDGGAECGDPAVPLILSEQEETPVTWTYSVFWRPSETAWATRWDKYLHVFDPRIHWFSLFSSTLIVVLLVGMVAVTLLRALRKDIARYNQVDQYDLDDLNGTSTAIEDGVQEDSGWKLVHGDVFRAPKYPLLLSIFLGSGAQLFVMTGITIGRFRASSDSKIP
jgi:transmembrane 9 superfamily protein 2/4